MSVVEMQQYIAGNVWKIDNPETLKEIIRIMEEYLNPDQKFEKFWTILTADYGDVLRRLDE